MAEENAIIANSQSDDLDSPMVVLVQNAQELYERGYNAVHVGDGAQALDLFRQAAHWGHRKSFSELYQLYDIGWGVEADPVEAALWLQRFSQSSDISQPNYIYWQLLSEYDLWPVADPQPFFERSPSETFEVLRMLLKRYPDNEVVSVAMEYFFCGGKLESDGAQLYLDYGDGVRLDVLTPQAPVSMARAFYTAQLAMTRALNSGYRGNWADNVGRFDILADDAGASLHFSDDSVVVLRQPSSQAAKASNRVFKLFFGGG